MFNLHSKLIGSSPIVYRGGGKGSQPAEVAQVAPTAPVQEASVEIDDPEAKNKLKTSKQSLKVPLATTVDTGLKI